MDLVGACRLLEEFGFYSEGDGKGSDPVAKVGGVGFVFVLFS